MWPRHRKENRFRNIAGTKWPAPLGSSPGGAVTSAKEPVSRILVCAVIPLDAASPRTFISDLPGGFGNCSSRLGASGRCAPTLWLLRIASLPIWSCSVGGLPCPPALQPERCALTAPFHPYLGA